MNLTIGTWLSANFDTIAFCVIVVAVCLYKIVKEWLWFLELEEDKRYHD